MDGGREREREGEKLQCYTILKRCLKRCHMTSHDSLPNFHESGAIKRGFPCRVLGSDTGTG